LPSALERRLMGELGLVDRSAAMNTPAENLL
jgi:hypothetical protein